MVDTPLIQSTEELVAFQEALRALHEVSLILTRQESVDNLCRQAVELGRQRLGFSRLALLFFDFQNHMIQGTFGTDERGNTTDERHYLQYLEPDSRLRHIINIGKRHHIFENVDLYTQGKIVGQGWNAMALMWDGEASIGWLTADNLLTGEPLQTYQLEILHLYATTVGHLIQRKRADEELREQERIERKFQQRLKALHEINTYLAHLDSLEDICRYAVEFGRSHLGFERLGVWLIDETDPNQMLGMFGTSDKGQVRDERGQRKSTDFTQFTLSEDGRILFYKDPHSTSPQRWNAGAQIWDGIQNMGWVFADNQFHGQLWFDYMGELLSLFGATIGHLLRTIKAKQALADERNLLRTIIDAVPDYIHVKDRAGRFMVVNKPSWKDFNFSSEADMLGKTDFDIFPAELATEFVLNEEWVMLRGETLYNQEEHGQPRSDGTPRYMLTTKVPLKDEQGNVTGLVGVTRDITDRKNEMIALALQNERIALLQEFITNLSHDIKTPLSNIKTSLYLLERFTDPSKQQHQLLVMKEQTILLEHILEDILMLSRLQNMNTPTATPVRLNTLILSITEQLRPIIQQKELELIFELDQTLPHIHGDEQLLYQMIHRLMENAVQYTRPKDKIWLKTLFQDQQIQITVRDSGIGISEEDLRYVFEHFYRADKARSMQSGGTGLGLTIAQRIAHIHQGRIEVESQLDQGTIFRVFLPYES